MQLWTPSNSFKIVLCAAATLFAFVAEGMTNGPAVQLSKADSLRHKQKMVQALMLYESILAEPLSGCEIARSHTGIAGIQTHAGNLEEAQPHLALAREYCGMCSNHLRSPMVLELSELYARSRQPQEALDLLHKELEWEPHPSQRDEIELAIVELNFALGNWGETMRMASQMTGVRALGLQIQAGVLMDIPLGDLPLEDLLQQHTGKDDNQVLAELTHVHTALTGLGKVQEAFDLSKKMAGLFNHEYNKEARALAQLRVALSAERAQLPMDALLAFHEAERIISESNNPMLRAKIAREQARFERKRGATDKALACLTLADSLTASMLHNSQITEEQKRGGFDPFEAAITDSLRPIQSPGMWPFAFALAALGLLAAALRSRQLKKDLRKERIRSLRLQRTILVEPNAATDVQGFMAPRASISSVTEQVLTQPERLDFDDIIASLEMDHGPLIDWELECNQVEGQQAPEGLLSLLSVTSKRLMTESEQDASYSGRIRSDWHGIHVEISGPESASTKELEGIFVAGHQSKMWSPVLAQIEKLAGQLTVEKRPTGDLALMFLLPYTRSSESLL